MGICNEYWGEDHWGEDHSGEDHWGEDRWGERTNADRLLPLRRVHRAAVDAWLANGTPETQRRPHIQRGPNTRNGPYASLDLDDGCHPNRNGRAW